VNENLIVTKEALARAREGEAAIQVLLVVAVAWW